ncbi:hypothetical protein ACFODT_01555 [Vibrio zhugei]|uniref:Uncharacterized protein n=1 Tax=Vibrio zhugei TaxID=2479546 RepID=A0ABV7C3K4_9VIBR|nr:hypothetical protein [Vibrio zhugei]
MASSVCFILLWTYCRPSRLLHQSLLGETRFVPEQRLIEGHRLIAYQHADLSYAPLVLIFTETKRKKWLLWRDACQDREYRQLLVLLKREQQGSRYAR